jgi:hypothetical protein
MLNQDEALRASSSLHCFCHSATPEKTFSSGFSWNCAEVAVDTAGNVEELEVADCSRTPGSHLIEWPPLQLRPLTHPHVALPCASGRIAGGSRLARHHQQQ